MWDIVATFWLTIQHFYAVFVDSTFFFVLKIFLVIYSTVVVVDVLLLVQLDGVQKRMRMMRAGTSAKKFSKSADAREWDGIKSRLQSEDAQQYLAAILEADRFVYKSLTLQGYSGSTFAERLAQIPPGSFSALDAVRDVHALSNKIVQKEDMQLTREQAQNALNVYEQFLDSIDIL